MAEEVFVEEEEALEEEEEDLGEEEEDLGEEEEDLEEEEFGFNVLNPEHRRRAALLARVLGKVRLFSSFIEDIRYFYSDHN